MNLGELKDEATDIGQDFREFAGEIRHIDGQDAGFRTASLPITIGAYAFASAFGKTGIGRGEFAGSSRYV